MEPSLHPKSPFPFPFPPYPIQQDFMMALYQGVSEGKLIVLESPTGTGKTLSLISGALHWYYENEHIPPLEEDGGGGVGVGMSGEKEASDGGKVEDESEPDWLRDAAESSVDVERERRREEYVRLLEAIGEKMAAAKGRVLTYRRKVARPGVFGQRLIESGEDARFQKRKRVRRKVGGEEDIDVVEELDGGGKGEIGGSGEIPTDEEAKRVMVAAAASRAQVLAASLRAQRSIAARGGFGAGVMGEGGERGLRQIIFASRTHSQLAQFVSELKKTVFWKDRGVRVVVLGGRKHLCVNDDVLALGSEARIAEACTELLDQGRVVGEKRSGGCEWKRDVEATEVLEAIIATESLPLEEANRAGRETHACPYFASRTAVQTANIIALPYASLVHSSTRQALGVDLKDSIVIVDEAHNLVDAVLSTHSASLSLPLLRSTHRQLYLYLSQRGTFISPQLRATGQLLQATTTALLSVFTKSTKPTLLSITEFLLQASDLAAIDIGAIARDPNTTKLCRILRRISPTSDTASKGHEDEGGGGEDKGGGGEEKVDDTTSSTTRLSSSTTGLYAVKSFLEALVTADPASTRVSFAGSEGKVDEVRIVLLDAAPVFLPLLQQPRALILSGGTMKPLDTMLRALAPRVPKEGIKVFSCGHVIPPTSLLGLTLSSTSPFPPSSSSDVPLLLNHAAWSDDMKVARVGGVVLDVGRVCPHGMVLFFPSYRAMERAVQVWKKTSSSLPRTSSSTSKPMTLFEAIADVKPVFLEPRGAADLDAFLDEFSEAACGSRRGALLFAVMGGKLSEGLNFKDDRCRLVAVAGLPYPNPSDPELAARMKYLNTSRHGDDSTGSPKRDLGREYYNALCIRSINQSIGRAIRHQGDWAAVLLLDQRYKAFRPNLPRWVDSRVQNATSQANAINSLRFFFQTKLALTQREKIYT